MAVRSEGNGSGEWQGLAGIVGITDQLDPNGWKRDLKKWHRFVWMVKRGRSPTLFEGKIRWKNGWGGGGSPTRKGALR